VTTTVFHRRRIERFAQLLEESEGGPRRHSRSPLDDEIAHYVAVGHRFALFQPPVEATPDADFRASLRAMLVATAEREGIGSTAGGESESPGAGQVYVGAAAKAKRPMLGGKRTRGAIIVGIAAGTLALSGMSMASGDAMPGDPLYGVKRGTENARLALAGSDLDRGQTYLGLARNRGTEAVGVRNNPNRLLPALSDMDDETVQGVRILTTAAVDHKDAAALGLVDDFVKVQRPVIAGLRTGLTGPSYDRVQQSLDLLDRVGSRIAGLRAGLDCASGGSPSDQLGPQPATCGGPSTTGQHKPGAQSGSNTPAFGPRPETTSTATGTTAPATGNTAPVAADRAGPAASPSSGNLLDELGRALGTGR
jgi:hypothetical protein